MPPRLLLAAVAGLAASHAFAEALPATARKATPDDVRALSDGKKVTVDVFDLGTPVHGNLVWDWTRKVITGTAVINGKTTIKVRSVLTLSADRVCAASKREKPSCHAVYIDGNRFFEVNGDGSLHAVSEVGR